MGSTMNAQRVLERRKGDRTGWVLTKGSEEFDQDRDWISAELAELADRRPSPFEVANMVPGRRASTSSVDQAAQEVAKWLSRSSSTGRKEAGRPAMAVPSPRSTPWAG